MQIYSHNLFSSASNTLCVPEVVALINTRMLFWACSTNKPEGYRGECVPPWLYLYPVISGIGQMFFDRFMCLKCSVGFCARRWEHHKTAWETTCWFLCDISLIAEEYLLLLTLTVPHVSGQSYLHVLNYRHLTSHWEQLNRSWWACAQD